MINWVAIQLVLKAGVGNQVYLADSVQPKNGEQDKK
jgi:hypothetical protein